MRKLRNTLLVFVSITFFLILTGCGGNSEANTDGVEANQDNSEKITLKLAIGAPATAPLSVLGIEPFMERVTELTDGQVEFDYYPAEQLGKSDDLFNLTSDGVTDIGYFAFNPNTSITNVVGQLPGLSQSTEEASVIYNELIREEPTLTTDFLNNDVIPIMGFTTPPFDIFTKGKEIKTPDDLKGVRINSAGGVLDEILKDLGAVPVTVQAADLYEAFDRGVIDALLQAASTAESYGMGDVVQYGTSGLNFVNVSLGLVMNKGTWDDLSPDIQEAIEQAAYETVKDMGTALDEDNNRVLEEWGDSATIYELNEKESDEWRVVLEEAQDKYTEQDDNLSETLNQYRELLEELR